MLATRLARFAAILSTAVFLALPAAVAQTEDDDDLAAGSPEWDDPDLPVDPRFEEARQHHIEGNFERAFAIYEEILADRGPDAATLTTYGNMRWKIGQMKEAERLLKAAIESMPKHIKSRQFLGQLYFHQGRRADARKTFEDLLALDWVRGDVADSARVNLARIALIGEDWKTASDLFVRLKREGGKADRASGERGMRKMRMMMELTEWPRHESKHLIIHFSPKLKQFSGPAAKEAFAAPLDTWIEFAVDKLGIAMPDPWHLYMFSDDGECSFITGRREAHGWDYSWWFSHSAVASQYGVKHTLAAQFAARWSGSRPIFRALVEGFCAYVSGDVADPHGLARAKVKSDPDGIASIADIARFQRDIDQYANGLSLTRYLIDTYGFTKFEAMWKVFNVTVNSPQYKRGRSSAIVWEEALDDLFSSTLGASYETINDGWHRALSGGN